MDDTKKQESQKTVVAFIAGLLIGGLLVWIFLPAPEATEAPAIGGEGDESAMMEEGTMDEGSASPAAPATPESTVVDETPAVVVSVDGFGFEVAAQPAGSSVALGEIAFPVTEGWVAVHDFDGTFGNALGAARFNTAAGLTPTSVELLRETVSGGTYAVVFYTDNGDRIFDLRTDALVQDADGEVVASTFVAQ